MHTPSETSLLCGTFYLPCSGERACVAWRACLCGVARARANERTSGRVIAYTKNDVCIALHSTRDM